MLRTLYKPRHWKVCLGSRRLTLDADLSGLGFKDVSRPLHHSSITLS